MKTNRTIYIRSKDNQTHKIDIEDWDELKIEYNENTATERWALFV